MHGSEMFGQTKMIGDEFLAAILQTSSYIRKYN